MQRNMSKGNNVLCSWNNFIVQYLYEKIRFEFQFGGFFYMFCVHKKFQRKRKSWWSYVGDPHSLSLPTQSPYKN